MHLPFLIHFRYVHMYICTDPSDTFNINVSLSGLVRVKDAMVRVLHTPQNRKEIKYNFMLKVSLHLRIIT